MVSRASSELETLLGEEAYLLLAEKFGGLRLYVPSKLRSDHEIVRTIGEAAAAALVERIAPDTIVIPLAREQRAARYRAEGRSLSEIARLLGLSEAGVNKIFRRLASHSAVNERASSTGSSDALFL